VQAVGGQPDEGVPHRHLAPVDNPVALHDADDAPGDVVLAGVVHAGEFRRLAAERGLSWEDPASFGLDYAETLRLWRERFDRAVTEGRLPPGFDQRFVGLWRFYLMYCEGGFRGRGIDVAQVTLVKRG
jgi:hypothetical protein